MVAASGFIGSFTNYNPCDRSTSLFLSFSFWLSLTHCLSPLSRMWCHSLTLTTKRSRWIGLIHLISGEWFLPCPPHSISHVFHPPSPSPPWQWLMTLSCCVLPRWHSHLSSSPFRAARRIKAGESGQKIQSMPHVLSGGKKRWKIPDTGQHFRCFRDTDKGSHHVCNN